ncbi:unnamed protein product [Paramecium pentaurelia]|uniref:Uncharacterized protein n=1 Tax=Paramecium pentaurelia TaxID=43138 RepID=A0A8S1U5R1_9CILI|nr:unnamed protein product [Paramecium pentaurelia]
MSKPGLGLNSFHLVFIQKSYGDIDEGNYQCLYSDNTIINKVRFDEEIMICFFHQKEKVTQIVDNKKTTIKQCLK